MFEPHQAKTQLFKSGEVWQVGIWKVHVPLHCDVHCTSVTDCGLALRQTANYNPAVGLLLRTQWAFPGVWWLTALFQMIHLWGKNKTKHKEHIDMSSMVWRFCWTDSFANWVEWKDHLPSALLLLFSPSPKGGREGTAQPLCEGKWKVEESNISSLCLPWLWCQWCGAHLILSLPLAQQTRQYFWDTNYAHTDLGTPYRNR